MDYPLALALVAALVVGFYVLADGFDLGIGILFLLAPRGRDRDVMMESIAPVWDGNETWLVLGAALLWAAFPLAFSILLPAFYIPVMVMLFALVFRGIAFEFRFQATAYQRVWDLSFAGGSLLATVCQGIILGGFIQGVPVANGVFAGSPFGFFSLLGLMCAAGLVGGYALLGAGWVIWKTTGPTQVFGREVGHAALILAATMMLVVSGWTALTLPAVAARWFTWPGSLALAPLPLAAIGVTALLWRSFWQTSEPRTFQLGILLFLLGYGGLAASIFPYAIPPLLTIWAAAADDTSLAFLSVGLAVILPIIIAYLAHAYYVFRGKTVGGMHGVDYG